MARRVSVARRARRAREVPWASAVSSAGVAREVHEASEHRPATSNRLSAGLFACRMSQLLIASGSALDLCRFNSMSGLYHKVIRRVRKLSRMRSHLIQYVPH